MNLKDLLLGDNLLPTNYQDTLNTLGLVFTVNYETQIQLTLNTGLNSYTIANESDLNNIDFLNIVGLSDSSVVSPTHNFILENNNVVDITDYVKNGVIQKSEKLFAQVRAIGTGLFPNNSDHGITSESIELNFNAVEYVLSFDLNGGTGIAPDTQEIVEGGTGIAVRDPQREGFIFKGWNTLADGTGTKWTPGTTPMEAKNIILFAQWEENENIEPSITDNSLDSKNSQSQLPKTGGPGIGFISLLILGSGLLVSFKGLGRNN